MRCSRCRVLSLPRGASTGSMGFTPLAADGMMHLAREARVCEERGGRMRSLESNSARLSLPAPLLWLSVLSCAGMGILMIAGGVQLATTADAALAMRVLPAPIGLAFVSTAAFLVTAGISPPRRDLDSVLRGSRTTDGVTITGSMRLPAVTVAVASTWLLSAFLGAVFARGSLQVALIVLATALAVATASGIISVSRPRYLRLTRDYVEAGAQRSTARLSWDDLDGVAIAWGGSAGGATVLRLLPRDEERIEVTWRHPLDRKPTGVDVDMGALRIETERLLAVIDELKHDRAARARLHTDPHSFLTRLASS